MFDVPADGSSEKDGLLRDQTNLRAQPLDVEFTDVNAVQLDNTAKGIVEALNEGDDGGFSRAGSTDERASLSCGEGDAEILDDRDIWARGVVEVDMLKGDSSGDAFGFQTSRVS